MENENEHRKIGQGRVLDYLKDFFFMIPNFLNDDIKGQVRESEENEGTRPVWEMPESVGKQVGLLEQMASGKMPGEDQLKQDIYSSTATGVGQIGQLAAGSSEAMTGLLGLKERETQSLQDLQTKSAMYQSQMNQNLAGAYGQQAEWENLGWDWNEGRRWGEAKNETWALKQQEQQMKQNWINMIGGIVPSMFGASNQMQGYQQQMPNYGGYGQQTSSYGGGSGSVQSPYSGMGSNNLPPYSGGQSYNPWTP